MVGQEKRLDNSRFAKVGVLYFNESYVQNSSNVYQMKFSAHLTLLVLPYSFARDITNEGTKCHLIE
ncbi:MAG: hypothetical protein EBU52_00180 [Cytophagia bacterium]|nr:hypothetical protein [Cytophagia bacterium]